MEHGTLKNGIKKVLMTSSNGLNTTVTDFYVGDKDLTMLFDGLVDMCFGRAKGWTHDSTGYYKNIKTFILQCGEDQVNFDRKLGYKFYLQERKK